MRLLNCLQVFRRQILQLCVWVCTAFVGVENISIRVFFVEKLQIKLIPSLPNVYQYCSDTKARKHCTAYAAETGCECSFEASGNDRYPSHRLIPSLSRDMARRRSQYNFKILRCEIQNMFCAAQFCEF